MNTPEGSLTFENNKIENNFIVLASGICTNLISRKTCSFEPLGTISLAWVGFYICFRGADKLYLSEYKLSHPTELSHEWINQRVVHT